MSKKIISTLCSLICISVICFFAYFVYSPSVYEITPRSYASMVLADTVAIRELISKNLANGTPVMEAGNFSTQSEEGKMIMKVDFGWVTSSGSIIVYNEEYGVVVVQEPIVSGENITWNCIVYPESAKPNADICKSR